MTIRKYFNQSGIYGRTMEFNMRTFTTGRYSLEVKLVVEFKGTTLQEKLGRHNMEQMEYQIWFGGNRPLNEAWNT